MRATTGRMKLCVCAAAILLAPFAAKSLKAQSQQLCSASGKVCVLTWQQDAAGETCNGCVYRTGENLSESTVTYSSIQTDNFQQLCSMNLDGQVYAQPLVVAGATVNGVMPANGVIYVVTQNDTLYAISGGLAHL